MRAQLWTLAAVFCLGIFGAPRCPAGEPAPAKVLVLQSYNPQNEWTRNESRGIQAAFDEAGLPVDLRIEYLDWKEHPEQDCRESFAKLLAARYGATKFAAVITSDDPALAFALEYRARLFPGTPIVFCGVNGNLDAMLGGQPNVTGMAETPDPGGTIALALRLRPETRELVVVHDNTETGRANRAGVEKLAPRFPQLRFRFITGLTFAQIARELEGLPDDAAVLFASLNRDSEGRVMAFPKLGEYFALRSHAPIYCLHDTGLGSGVVGGSLLSGRLHGKQAGALAVRILRGTPAGEVPIIRHCATRLAVDYGALQRWRIPLANVPPECEVLGRPESFWARNGTWLLITLALTTVFVTVILLLAVNIRRRREAARALKQSQERYRLLLNNAGEGIAVLQGANFQFVNETALRLTGYSREELLARPVLEFLHPDDRILVATQYRKRMEGADALDSYEVRIFHKNGETLWAQVKATMIDWNGAPAALDFFADITGRKRAEDENRRLQAELEERVARRTEQLAAANAVLKREVAERLRAENELKRSSEFLESILNSLPNPVVVKDEQHQLLMVNDTWCESTGFKREDVLGRDIQALFPREQVRVFYEKDNLVFRTGLTVENEEDVTSAGRTRHLLTRKTMHVDPSGRRILLAVITDISERREMEEELRRSRDELEVRVRERTEALTHAVVELRNEVEERTRAEAQLLQANTTLNAILEATPLPVFLIDLEGRVDRIWNPAAERILGWTKAEVLGRRLPTVPEGDWGEFPHAVEQLRGGLPIEGWERTRLRRDGSTLACAIFGAALRDSKGEMTNVLSVLVDLTEQHKAEAERRQLEARIMQTQKLESLGVLAGGIAHDFNNLLTGVLGYASLALDTLPPESGARGSVRQIETAARRAAELTRQMLAYSGKGKFVIQAVDLAAVVTEMTHLLEVSISKRCKLIYRFGGDVPPIEADVTQLRQIVMNLIINASEALGDAGGTITIATGCADCDRAYLSESYLDENLVAGRYVFLEVADTGCGMKPEVVARVFEPFFTTKFTGRGLGLAAVLGIVRGHHGAVKVYSEPGRGTAFKVLFPASARGTAPLSVAHGASTIWRGTGTVLVVDDEPTVRQTAQAMLGALGFGVLAAGNGLEALEIVKAGANPIDAVLLDLTMPEMDGEETFRELRRIRPDVRVILSSGYNEQHAVNQFIGKKLAGFVQKPYSLRELADAMRKAFQLTPGD